MEEEIKYGIENKKEQASPPVFECTAVICNGAEYEELEEYELDLAGNPRLVGDAIDLGAYECEYEPFDVIPVEVIDTNYTVNKIDRSKQLCEPENSNYL